MRDGSKNNPYIFPQESWEKILEIIDNERICKAHKNLLKDKIYSIICEAVYTNTH